jgi:hypothetical protein
VKQLTGIIGLGLSVLPLCAAAQTLEPITAPSSARPFGVEATAPQWCALTTASGQVVASGPTNNAIGPVGSELRIVDLVDATTLSTRAANATIGFDAACNYPHRVTVRSQNNGLRRGAAATGVGIASAVPYTATLNWGDANLSFFADAQSQTELAREISTIGAVSGQLVVQVAIAAGATNIGPGSPLGAGEYSDVISIEVGPL